jgi:hypothetical protein
VDQSFGKEGEVGAGCYEEVLAGGPDLTERKQLLAKDAECFIALPGGPGTWEELWEIVCQRQLGLPPPNDESAAGIAPARRGRGPVCLVNVDGFYDGFIATAERAVADGLLHWKGADAVAGPRATAAAGDEAPHLLMHRHTAAAALACCVEAVGGHCSVSASLSHCVHDKFLWTHLTPSVRWCVHVRAGGTGAVPARAGGRRRSGGGRARHARRLAYHRLSRAASAATATTGRRTRCCCTLSCRWHQQLDSTEGGAGGRRDRSCARVRREQWACVHSAD